MRIERIRQQAMFALGLFEYLKQPLTIQAAIEDLTRRIDQRELAFLAMTKRLIYDQSQNPYRKLLRWAGCDYADLESLVKTRGLDRALESLRDAGVYLTLEEFKSKAPIIRSGLTVEFSQNDLDNPFLTDRSIEGGTSGTTSASVRVLYDWNLFVEEAANELLLYEVHDIVDAKAAFWLPALPSISGIHNLLVQLKSRTPPDVWFSHLPGNFQSRAATRYFSLGSRFYGMRIAQPEFTPMNDAQKVVRWMQQTLERDGKCSVKTFASSAVRIADVAQQMGIDLTGTVVFCGGEPLTAHRHRYLQNAGMRAYPRYVATETGFLAASCPHATAPDSMHLYIDRVAVIRRERAFGESKIPAYLFSTLSPYTGKVLLNTELGDFGNLEIRNCDCLFGKTGMNVQISEVRSFDKTSGEGMTIQASLLNEVIAEVIERTGGGPDDYQFWEKPDPSGIVRIVIAIDPSISELNESVFIQKVLTLLKRKGPAAEIASQFWEQANTFQIVRECPAMSKGFKLLPFIRK